jgi:hypothetical protein
MTETIIIHVIEQDALRYMQGQWCGVPKKVCPPSSTSYKMASKNPSPWRLAIPSAPDTGPAAPPHRRRRRPFPPPLEERSSGGRPVDSLGPSLWAPRQSTRSLRPPSGPAGRQRRRWRRQRCWGSSSRRWSTTSRASTGPSSTASPATAAARSR